MSPPPAYEMVELPFAAPSEPEREGSTPDVARVPMPVEAVIQHTPSPAPPLYFDIIRDEPDESSTTLNGSGNHLGEHFRCTTVHCAAIVNLLIALLHFCGLR